MIGEASYKRYITWIMLGVALLCGFLVFWYADIGDTLDNGVLLAESVVKGEFLDYYEYAALNSSPATKYSANYNVLLYAIFALWNLPTVILHLITGFDYMSALGALIWCKLIIFAAYVGIFLTVRKITKLFGGNGDDGILAGFLSVSSLCVFVPSLVASQYDCIALLFMLLGIRFFAEGKTLKFLLMFAIAVPLKLFAVFILLPMLLIRYKNVLKIVGMLAAVMAPSFLLELPFRGDPYYSVAMDSQNGDAAELLLGANVSIGSLKVNLFIIAYIVICFFCYIKRDSDPVQQGKLAVYFSFATFGAFCVLVPIRSYWIVLYTPFLAILAALKKSDRTVPILIDTLAGLGGGLFILANHWIYNTGYIAGRLILRYWYLPDGTEQKYGHFEGFLESMGMSDLKYAFFAVFAGSILFALWYLYPDKENTIIHLFHSSGTFWAAVSRPVILLAVFALLVYCNFASQPKVKYGSEASGSAAKVYLMQEETISRKIKFENDETLTEMSVWLKPSGVTRAARSFVGITLTDDSTGEEIWEGSVGIAVVDGDSSVDFELDELEVKCDRTYTVEMYGVDVELVNKGGDISPYLDKNDELAVLFR